MHDPQLMNRVECQADLNKKLPGSLLAQLDQSVCLGEVLGKSAAPLRGQGRLIPLLTTALVCCHDNCRDL